MRHIVALSIALLISLFVVKGYILILQVLVAIIYIFVELVKAVVIVNVALHSYILLFPYERNILATKNK